VSKVDISSARSRVRYAWRITRAGLPGFWVGISTATIVIGGNVLLAFTWGVKHLLLGIAIALAIIVLVVIEGSYRVSRRVNVAPESPSLAQLRELAIEGHVIRARIPDRDSRGLIAPPSDMRRGFEAWRSKADSALEPWPTCQAQFRGQISYSGILLLQGDREFAEIEQRTKVFEKIRQALIDQGMG
jgi:hypothetical protein